VGAERLRKVDKRVKANRSDRAPPILYGGYELRVLKENEARVNEIYLFQHTKIALGKREVSI
jgi:hypothetical protein